MASTPSYVDPGQAPAAGPRILVIRLSCKQRYNVCGPPGIPAAQAPGHPFAGPPGRRRLPVRVRHQPTTVLTWCCSAQPMLAVVAPKAAPAEQRSSGRARVSAEVDPGEPADLAHPALC